MSSLHAINNEASFASLHEDCYSRKDTVGCIGTIQSALLQQNNGNKRQSLSVLMQQLQWDHDSDISKRTTPDRKQEAFEFSNNHTIVSDSVADDFFEDYPECVGQIVQEDDESDDDEISPELPQQQHDSVPIPAPDRVVANPYNNNTARPIQAQQQKERADAPANKPSTNPFQSAAQYGQLNEEEKQEQDFYGWDNAAQYNQNAMLEQPHQQPHNSYNSAPPPPPPQEIVRPNIPDSLKRKFQPPSRKNSNSAASKKRSGSNMLSKMPGNSNNESNHDDQEELPPELQHLDAELVKKIQNEILESGESITFDDIAGLAAAKQTVMELVCWPMKRPDLFTGLRRAPNGLLLFGPPGTGKTLIGKAIAHESGACFFSISSSSLTSKWIGEGEKLVRTLFAVARYREPAVVFIDEIDSLLTQRKADENEASRRIKTEFLVQLDGTSTSGDKPKTVLVIGATNLPHELDDAARRRFVKRLYIPLPESQDRKVLLQRLLNNNQHLLTDADFGQLADQTHGFSGADLKSLCTEAAMGPIRELGSRALNVKSTGDIPPISKKHFDQALCGTKPSVAQTDLEVYLEWNKTYGSSSSMTAPTGDQSDESTKKENDEKPDT